MYFFTEVEKWTGISMKWMNKIVCFLFSHELTILWKSNFYGVERLRCKRCKDYFHIQHDTKSFLKEDAELFKFYLNLRNGTKNSI